MSKHAEVISLDIEDAGITEEAKEAVENAGFDVTVKRLSRSDLVYLEAIAGVKRLPAVKIGDQAFQGMQEIRAHFAK